VYLTLKHIHMAFVALSLLVFMVRGIWLFMDSSMLGRRWAKIVPHIVNAILLASGIALAAYLNMSPGDQPWLMAKIVGLIFYVGLGVAAFRAPSPIGSKLLWVSALVAFFFVVSVAVRKTPFGFFG
jgi:uncharacterized membrane protein SirB2